MIKALSVSLAVIAVGQASAQCIAPPFGGKSFEGSSPFGVWRTSGSNGWHMGIDLTNKDRCITSPIIRPKQESY